jgi:hypothetical protein
MGNKADVNMRSSDGATALMHACLHPVQPRKIRALLAYHADATITVEYPLKDGKTEKESASSLIRTSLKKADPSSEAYDEIFECAAEISRRIGKKEK